MPTTFGGLPATLQQSLSALAEDNWAVLVHSVREEERAPSFSQCVAVAVVPLQHRIPDLWTASVSGSGAAEKPSHAEVLAASHVSTLQRDFSSNG
jgi:hypothetical protein